ncbi:MAG: DUF6524 family protein [Agarilytica sp.]
MENLTWLGFSLRFLFACLLVFLSYNPTGYSYLHWFSFAPLPVLGGIILVIGWAIYIRATLRSIGIIGLGLLSALLACIIWLFVDIGWLSLQNISVFSWVIELCIVVMLAVGMSWSHVRRRISGQVDTDDVDG